MNPLSPEELGRYDRHLMLSQVGSEGQQRLKNARVLLVGLGGLGSPAALYLAAAGVGCLGLVDGDRVDESNLQRQVLYGTDDVGRGKTEAASARLQALNPHLQVIEHSEMFGAANGLGLCSDYDLVLDGSDNFATRYLVNDACVLAGKPNVYGSVYRFQGQVSVFHPAAGGPCYRCLHPQPPPPGSVPSCAEAGVLGVLPGVVGTLQATEAIKLILGAGKGLAGRLLVFEALGMKFRELAIPKDPHCALCGAEPSITALEEIVVTCDFGPGDGSVEPEDFAAGWAEGRRPRLLDVREPYEWEIANLQAYGAELVPLATLEERAVSWDRQAEIVVYCKSGVRSRQAVEVLQKAGFANVKDLNGGILKFADEVLPELRRY